ncbi:DUF202 domain-containing protein [Ramlibacter sp.]|uniref:DUF202 domain-containing protein n=1 Tax=Ramlibacter sp. TaxID=1917967 RepID=UPI002C6629D5|nr:DUF202 domain-containing protein [Ramlibacter sp.]HWI81337.1 DUF202 domain-containing protein [Ramlibacter sp.]
MTVGHGPGHGPRDPGLQGERTALAWSRTGLAMLANALLALRAGWVQTSRPVMVLGIGLLAAAAAAFLYGRWRRRGLVEGRGAIAPPALAMTVAAAVMLLACATGLASIWLPALRG